MQCHRCGRTRGRNAQGQAARRVGAGRDVALPDGGGDGELAARRRGAERRGDGRCAAQHRELRFFECRGRNRVPGAKISEHGKANALDVRALKLANGKAIELTDVNVDKAFREDLRKTACGRFSTILGPGSDGYHEEHIHFDLIERRNNYKICEWDVLDAAEMAARAAAKAAAAAARAAIAKATADEIPLPRPRPVVDAADDEPPPPAGGKNPAATSTAQARWSRRSPFARAAEVA